MGAGARLAEERDRWADDWQVADLDQESEHLLALLERSEELRAAVPGMRIPHAADGGDGATAAPVLIGVTDTRVLVVGRWSTADLDRSDDPRCVTASLEEARDGRGSRLDLPGAELELDPVALDRLWEHLDGPAWRVRRG